MPQKNPSELVVGYCRISDENVKLDSATMESQAKEITKYCKKKNLTLLHIYPESKSGFLKPFRQREVFMSILEMARKGLIQAVVVTEYCRLSRRQGEQAVIVEILRSYGVKVYSCTEDFDDSALGQFMRAAAAFSAESERDKVVYRTTRGMRDRVESGHISGRGHRMYGYTRADTLKYKNGCYVLVAEEARIVVWMYERADEGWSYRQIAIRLTEMEVPTLTGKPYWNYGTVAQILKNPLYTGSRATAFRYAQNANGHSRIRPEEEHTPLPNGVVPQIVPEVIFDRVQKQLENHKKFSPRNNPYPSLSLMRSLVRCGICGCVMQVQHHMDRRSPETVLRSEYVCHRRTGNPDLLHHHSTSIQTTILDSVCWEEAKRFLRDPQLMRQHITTLRHQRISTIDTKHIESMLEALRLRYKRLFDMAEECSDTDTYEELKHRLQGIEQEKRELEGILKDAGADADVTREIDRLLTEFERWAADKRPFIDDPTYEPTLEQKRAAILAIGIQAKVWPVNGEHRYEITVLPPDLVQLISVVDLTIPNTQP